jgi:hypothetical protein
VTRCWPGDRRPPGPIPGPSCRRSSNDRSREIAIGDIQSKLTRQLLGILITSITGAAGLVIAGCHPHMATPAERGAVIYRTNCIACHNANPNLPGSLGPAIAGSPRDLVAARVLHGAYPVGYVPKRHTHIMRPLPWLGPHIGDLTAFLDAAYVSSNRD